MKLKIAYHPEQENYYQYVRHEYQNKKKIVTVQEGPSKEKW